jgi:hypothetical protein
MSVLAPVPINPFKVPDNEEVVNVFPYIDLIVFILVCPHVHDVITWFIFYVEDNDPNIVEIL